MSYFGLSSRGRQTGLGAAHHGCAICAAEIDTAPADAAGQMNFPRSRRLA